MKVDKISHMGSDLTVVNAASVSFDKESVWDLKVSEDRTYIKRVLKDEDKRLINFWQGITTGLRSAIVR